MASITVNGQSLEWTGMWTHRKSGFTVDRNLISARQILELADRGLTHVYGSEAAAKFNGMLKAGKATMAERDTIVGAERVTYRDAMYADNWATGTRAPRVVGDRLAQLFWMDAAKRTRELADANFPKGTEKDTWIDPADGVARDIQAWVDRYLENDDPDESDPTRTKGDARRAVHQANAEAAFAAEKARAEARMETRKITGTKI